MHRNLVLIVAAALLAMRLVAGQVLPSIPAALNPTLNSRNDDATYRDSFRRGYETDGAVQEETIDDESIRRADDHFANKQRTQEAATLTVGGGGLNADGLITGNTGSRSDAARQTVDRGSFANDRSRLGRRGESFGDLKTQTGTRSGRFANRVALGGPIQASDTAYDVGDFNRADEESRARRTDYVRDADQTAETFDRGFIDKSLDTKVNIVQAGGGGGASTGHQTGRAERERSAGVRLENDINERGGAVNELAKRHDAAGRVRSHRASTAFSPDGAMAAGLRADQIGWDRGDVAHRDEAAFQRSAHDRLLAVDREKAKTDVDEEAMIGAAIPGLVFRPGQKARASETNDRVIERDIGDRLTTNAESTTQTGFDVGGRTEIHGNGALIGIPVI